MVVADLLLAFKVHENGWKKREIANTNFLISLIFVVIEWKFFVPCLLDQYRKVYATAQFVELVL